MNDDNYLKKYGFNRETVIGMFLPNTYEFWWNTDADGFFNRMYKEYNKFWNRERTGRAREINLTQMKSLLLLPYLYNETNKEDEYRRIAGVYMNRLESGDEASG